MIHRVNRARRKSNSVNSPGNLTANQLPFNFELFINLELDSE